MNTFDNSIIDEGKGLFTEREMRYTATTNKQTNREIDIRVCDRGKNFTLMITTYRTFCLIVIGVEVVRIPGWEVVSIWY